MAGTRKKTLKRRRMKGGVFEGWFGKADVQVAPNSVASNPVAPNPVAPNPVAPNPVAPNPVAPNPVAPNPAQTWWETLGFTSSNKKEKVPKQNNDIFGTKGGKSRSKKSKKCKSKK